MRYDLEFNIVSQLSSAGLSELAEIFYSNDEDKITPAEWDTNTLIGSSQGAANAIDTSRFNNLEKISSLLYASGVSGEDDISLNRLITKNNIICPMFDAGYVYFNKYKVPWSNNVVRKQFSFDDSIGYYKCSVDENINTEEVHAYTLAFKYPGYVDREKEWFYVEFIYDDLFTLKQNLDITFSSYPDTPYKLTIYENIAYISGPKISVENLRLGTAYANMGSMMALSEYPIDETTFTINGYDEDNQGEYSILTSSLLFNNTSEFDLSVIVSYDITPVLVYEQTERSNNPVVYAHSNILPSALGFKNGIIALHNSSSVGSTIVTDDGMSIVMPMSIDLEADKTDVEVLEPVTFTATLTGIGDIPVKDASITFEVESSNGDAKFIESGKSTYTVTTAIDGTATASTFIDKGRYGWYLQKEWVSGNKIYLPFDVETDDVNSLYLYFVTSDDPILGKLNSEYLETAINEYYTSESSLTSYYVSGRKIAYVELRTRQGEDSNTLFSSYKKPISISRNNEMLFKFRNLFIQNSNQDIMDFVGNMDDIRLESSIPSTSVSSQSLGYKDGVIPLDTLRTYPARTSNGSVIEFEDNIPTNKNVIGFWLVTGSASGASVKATFHDDNSFVHLVSSATAIATGSYINSEDEYVLHNDAEDIGTELSGFGYYSISDYLENPYKQNAATYTCRYCDAKNGVCLSENSAYSDKFAVIAGTGICSKPKDHDTLGVEEQCMITTNKYLVDESNNPLPEQVEIATGTFVDVYEWADQRSLLTYNGRYPHEALYFGDLDQSTFDTLLASEDIVPVYQEDTNYEPNAWGFINPFVMIPEKP